MEWCVTASKRLRVENRGAIVHCECVDLPVARVAGPPDTTGGGDEGGLTSWQGKGVRALDLRCLIVYCMSCMVTYS